MTGETTEALSTNDTLVLVVIIVVVGLLLKWILDRIL